MRVQALAFSLALLVKGLGLEDLALNLVKTLALTLVLVKSKARIANFTRIFDFPANSAP